MFGSMIVSRIRSQSDMSTVVISAPAVCRVRSSCARLLAVDLVEQGRQSGGDHVDHVPPERRVGRQVRGDPDGGAAQPTFRPWIFASA